MTNLDPHRMLPGSLRKEFGGTFICKPAVSESIHLVLRLRPSEALSHQIGDRRITRAELHQQHRASKDDMQRIIEFARDYELWLDGIDVKRRLVFVHAPVRVIENVFLVDLRLCKKNGRVFRVRSGHIYVPHSVRDVITGVFGLDERPQTRPHLIPCKTIAKSSQRPNAFDGQQLANIYKFPPASGTGQTIGIIELGGGFLQSDLSAFFSALSLSVPEIVTVSVDGAGNLPIVDPDADGEVTLDIEVAGAAAPNAKLVVYFAPNTDSGFLQAILTAVHDETNKPDIISISWGGAEITWTEQAMTAMNEAFQTAAALGISVFVADGDDGANDNENDGATHADFPATSPWVTATGGTSLVITQSSIVEVAWNDGNGSATGGGISDVFDRPSYQLTVSMPANLSGGKSGRGVPDVAAVADPNTGYAVFVHGFWQVYGGTSAVAPLFSALAARISQLMAHPLGFANPLFYQFGSSCFNDIVSGNNSCDGIQGYSAGLGWDAVSGWGSPIGTNILQAAVRSNGSSAAA